MKIIVPSAGSVPDQRTVDYVINIARRLNAQLVVLRILSEKETEVAGKQCLHLFVEGVAEDDFFVHHIRRAGDEQRLTR